MQKQFKTQPESSSISDETLEKINRFTKKKLSADEVYVFSAVLCDNEIDRDGERFSVQALYALAPLFEGKTAILNHSMDAADQSARTFETQVVVDSTRKTACGENYTYLLARSYLPRIAKNETLIAEIDAGIKKEVSVGCAVAKRICSVCGADERQSPCGHRRGKTYDGKTCHYILDEPTDAYEWSFVAVPAQKNAGVTKAFRDADALCKAIREKQSDALTLSSAELTALADRLDTLEKSAADGAMYRDALRTRAVKGFARTLPALDNTLAEALVAPLTAAQLKMLTDALDETAEKSFPAVPMLAHGEKTSTAQPNTAFKF